MTEQDSQIDDQEDEDEVIVTTTKKKRRGTRKIRNESSTQVDDLDESDSRFQKVQAALEEQCSFV